MYACVRKLANICIAACYLYCTVNIFYQTRTHTLSLPLSIYRNFVALPWHFSLNESIPPPRLGISFPKILNGNYTHQADCVYRQLQTECEIYTHRIQWTRSRPHCAHTFSFACKIYKIDNTGCIYNYANPSRQILYVCICPSNTRHISVLFPSSALPLHIFRNATQTFGYCWDWKLKIERKRFDCVCVRIAYGYFHWKNAASYDWKFARFALHKLFSTCI